MPEDTILCPECGWTGGHSALDMEERGPACPVCGTVIDAVQ